MSVTRKVFLLVVFILMSLSFSGCLSQKEADPFGKSENTKALDAVTEGGLELRNVHVQEYTNEQKSQYSNVPQ